MRMIRHDCFFSLLYIFDWFGLLGQQQSCGAYRIVGSENETKPFEPYEKGFVGTKYDPKNEIRTIPNQGFHDGKPGYLKYHIGPNRQQSCPGMVGPIIGNVGKEEDEDEGEGKYYCQKKENGYCDRRTGTCYCNVGYAGVACDQCSINTHFMIGNLCYPKKPCPNDCSNAGKCNPLTGICQCYEYREGEDCSQKQCNQYHPLCTHCNQQDGCISCISGYYLSTQKKSSTTDQTSTSTNSHHGQVQVCESCAMKYDPRCQDCDDTRCLQCMDMLLTSIRRSGKRQFLDQDLAPDELKRELSLTIPFGSQQTNAFDEAESNYQVISSPDNANNNNNIHDSSSMITKIPLKDYALSCHEGIHNDVTTDCELIAATSNNHTPISHIICGHSGVFSFQYPTYEISEGTQHIRLTVNRSGGGVGMASVSYTIQHISTDDADLTSTAFYTTKQTLHFQPNEISKSFLITIHNDRKKEGNESFMVTLVDPSSLTSLGNQFRAVVTILDDDENRTCSRNSYTKQLKEDKDNFSIAGNGFNFTIHSKTCLNQTSHQTSQEDSFLVIARRLQFHKRRDYENDVYDKYTQGIVYPNISGVHECCINVTTSGLYDLYLYLLIPGGLMGHYFADIFSTSNKQAVPEVSRIDSIVNFTWSYNNRHSNTTPSMSLGHYYYPAVRWEGCIQSEFSERHTFWIEANDSVRFWIDGTPIMDVWDRTLNGVAISASHYLKANKFYEIIFEYRVYDKIDDAFVKLMWESKHIPLQVIPSKSLFVKENIKGSPFNFMVSANIPNAIRSMPYGEGLYYVIAGENHDFSIIPRDAYGNTIYPYHNDPKLALDGYEAPIEYNDFIIGIRKRYQWIGVAYYYSSDINDNIQEDFTNSDNENVPITWAMNYINGHYDATFVPRKSGIYQLYVKLCSTFEDDCYYVDEGDKEKNNINYVFGSPYQVQTVPGEAFAANSITLPIDQCFDPNDDRNQTAILICPPFTNIVAGHEHSFIIKSIDLHNNELLEGGIRQWDINLRPYSGTGNKNQQTQYDDDDDDDKEITDYSSIVQGYFHDFSNGTYKGYFTPITAGLNLLSVKLNGLHIKDSPFQILVEHGELDGLSSSVVSS